MTSTTTASLPSDIAVEEGVRVVSSGESAGVQWFFSHKADPDHEGTCFEFDSDPALRRRLSSSPVPGTRMLIGDGDFTCQQPPKVPASDQAVLGLQLFVIVKATVSEDKTFSVLAGEVAPGVTALRAQYPDGSQADLPLDSAHVFVAISKPPQAPPTAIDVQIGARRTTCHSVSNPPGDSDPPDYLCDWSS